MLRNFTVILLRDGVEMDRGAGANVLGGPISALRHFVSGASRFPGEFPLRPGDLVTTGTLTKALPVAPGKFGAPNSPGIPLMPMKIIFSDARRAASSGAFRTARPLPPLAVAGEFAEQARHLVLERVGRFAPARIQADDGRLLTPLGRRLRGSFRFRCGLGGSALRLGTLSLLGPRLLRRNGLGLRRLDHCGGHRRLALEAEVNRLGGSRARLARRLHFARQRLLQPVGQVAERRVRIGERLWRGDSRRAGVSARGWGSKRRARTISFSIESGSDHGICAAGSPDPGSVRPLAREGLAARSLAAAGGAARSGSAGRTLGVAVSGGRGDDAVSGGRRTGAISRRFVSGIGRQRTLQRCA